VKESDREQGGAQPPRLLVLAAVARAQRHRSAPGTGVTQREISQHLGARPRSAAARAARAALERLASEGALRCERRHGVAVWAVTDRGAAALAGARGAALASQLPEAPQHRRWRLARARAADAIGDLRAALQGDLREAKRLLAAGEPAPADAWFALAERLACDAWRVGSAIYCLHEWREPGDERADVDTGSDAGDAGLAPAEREQRRRRRAGRRNVALWER
jgi:hypothetical protein